MTTHALKTAEPPSPATSICHFSLADLHTMHSVLSAGADAVYDRLAQPRVTDQLESLLIELIRPFSETVDRIVDEVRTRAPADLHEVRLKTELVVGSLLSVGEVEEAAEAAAEILNEWKRR
ncbi:hypothetical protein [Hansschlegelia sp.]|uniref:hypothetical protein n=1 Tax=Hansschlegelia sp. TaxID=2041892 RepID=UPI002B9D7A15|nr:hypothetical protein [Hansschlegelia sp.]HVI30420.1 hypothetical protein [Hansschlegelia sp.]